MITEIKLTPRRMTLLSDMGIKELNDLINYVIGKIKEEDYKVLEEGIKKAADATVCLIKEGTAKAMNKFNKV